MEYQRKIRWANYGTSKCKEYLRNDFSHECAYCKLQEKEVGLIDASYFEVDHFRPQSDDSIAFNPHLYSNLYYSCEKCNGEKSDTWSELLLDPCNDDVFSGEYPSVTGGYSSSEFYKYIAQNDKGSYYIDTLKLNSRHHIRIRKQRMNRQNNIRQIDDLLSEILHKFSSKKNLANLGELIGQLDQLRLSKMKELAPLSKNIIFEAIEEYLTKRDIKNSVVLEEYNMDVKIKIKEDSYYCEVIIDNTDIDNEVKVKYVNTEKLATWFDKLKYQFGILYYYTKLNKLYFYPISKLITNTDINKSGVKQQIKLAEANLVI